MSSFNKPIFFDPVQHFWGVGWENKGTLHYHGRGDFLEYGGAQFLSAVLGSIKLQ